MASPARLLASQSALLEIKPCHSTTLGAAPPGAVLELVLVLDVLIQAVPGLETSCICKLYL